MNQPGSVPDANVWALSDLATPWCLHVAVTLEIADRIAAGITEIDARVGNSYHHLPRGGIASIQQP